MAANDTETPKIDPIAPPKEIDSPASLLPSKPREIGSRSLMAMISGGIGAVIGFAAGKIYVTDKLYNYDKEVARLTRQDITGKRGLGAAASSASGMESLHPGAAFGGLAPGISSHAIQEAHSLELLEKSEHKFASMLYRRLGGFGGRDNFALITAAVTGTAALAGYLALSPKKKAAAEDMNTAGSSDSKEWSNRVAANETDKPRTLN